MPQEIIRNVRIENLSSPIVTAQILNSGAYGTDHSSLINLSVDDHPQYFNIERGDLRYLKLSEYSNDHSSLINLNADDHPQYFNIERGDLRYLKLSDFIQGHVIENEGIPLIQRANLNFVGGGVTVTDNGNDTSIVTIPDASIDKLCQINDVYCYTGGSDSDSSAPLGALPECIPADGSILIYDCEAENPGWYPSPQQQLPTVLFTDVDGEGTLRYVTPTPNSPNTIDAGVTNSYILSGRQNTINSGVLNTIISGSQNRIFGGNLSVISGGSHNKIYTSNSFIGGGQENIIRGSYGFIAGGYDNEIGNGTTGSSILGGWNSYVGGDYSVASGKNASTATFDGTFAFADSTTNVRTIIPNANDQFAIKAAGGLRLIDGQQGANKVLTSDANGVGHWADPTGSSSLNSVGAGSTTSSDSTYTLTNNVDVKFNSSEGNPIFKLDESAESILIGAESHTITGRENKLYIEGDGNTTLTRTQFAVKNTGPASGAAFDMICSDGGAISIQASGPGYGGGHKAWVYSYEGLPLFLASDGDMPSGGFNDISFSPGGWDNTSVWFKPSGNVGIGTSSPITALHIEKDMGAVGGEGIYVRNTNSGGFSEVVFDNNATTNNGSFVFGYGGTNTGSPNHAYFWNRKSAPIKFGTNNLERLRIDNGGNVGINISTPSAKLHVSNDDVTVNAGLISGTAPTSLVSGNGTTINSTIVAGSSSFNRPVFQGRRSRGTLTSPSAVINNDYIMSFVASGYDGSASQFGAAIDFFADANATNGSVPTRISLSTGSNSSNRTERLTVKSDGKVGIGQTDPTATLHVDSDDNEAVRIYCANSTGNTATGIRIMNKTGGSGDFASLSFGAGTTTNTRARMGAKFGADGTSGSYVFQTRTLAGNLEEKMVISSEGEVGIGTSSPESLFHIADGGGLTRTWNAFPGTTLLFEQGDITKNADMSIISDRAKIAGINFGDQEDQNMGGVYYSNLDNSLNFFTNNYIGTYDLTIDNTGSVGVGTSDPSHKLEVVGNGITSTNTSAAAILRANRTDGKIAVLAGGGNGSFFGYDKSGAMNFLGYDRTTLEGNVFSTSTAVALSIASGDNPNVGIGTLTPSAKLEVAGQIKITGGNPQANYVLTSDATGLASWQAAGTGGGPIAINDLTDVDTSTSAPNNGESLVWNSTTSKWEPSLITGGTGSVGTLQTVTNNGNTTTNPIEFNIGGAGQEFIKINATASSGRPLTFYDNGSFVGGIDYNFTGDYWSFDVSDSLGGRVTDAFTIQSETDDNFIGFGTSTPDAKLHINATAVNGRETLLKGSVSDAGDDAFYLGNGTTVNGRFNPRFAGYVNSSGTGYSQSFWGMTNIANDASDSSSFGLTHFSAMRSSGLPSDPTNGTLSEIENRKLFTFGGFGPNIYMTMAAGGNLGLGTGTPDAPLHINASAINGRENLIKGSVSDGGNDAFYLGNGTSTTNSFVPRFAGYVDSFDNKPATQFWGLTNSANDTSDSSSTGLINFAAGISSNATDPTNGTLTPALERKLFTFSDISGGTNHMTIAAGGNVGFGTDTPEAKVDVSGRMRFQATTAPAPTSGKGFEAFYSSGGDKSYFLSVDRDPSTDLLKGIDMRGSSLEFWTGADLNNDAIRLKVEDDGVEILENIKILNSNNLTGAPAFRCLDSANANFRIQSSLRNGSQNTSFNIDAVGQPGDTNREVMVIGYFTGAPDRYKITSNQTGSGILHPIHFEMGWDAPVMVIETDGKVGIGTTTPDKGLNITGSGPHSTLKITDDGTGSAAAEMYIGSNDGWSFFNERSTKNFNFRETITSGSLINADRLTIQQGGNIGIGTTTPTAKLEVAGQVKITGGNPGTGKVLTSDAGGTASWQEPTGGGDPVAAPTAETSLYIDAGGLLETDGGASASTGGDAGTNNSIDWWNVDTNEELFCKVAMSPQWDGGDIDVEFFWTATGASAGDNVRWAAAATGGSNGDVWDAAFSTVTETDDDLLIANGDVHVVKASGITPAGTTDDGSILFLKLKRTPTVGQTASVDARLLGVRVHYKNLVHRSWYINKMGGEDVEADVIISEKTAWIAPADGIIYGVHSGVSTIPSGAGISIDVKAAGNSILSVLGVIAAGESSSDQGGGTSHVIQGGSYSFSKGDRISFEINSFGGTGGKGLHTDLQISWAQ